MVMPTKKTTAEFVALAQAAHGPRYDYSRACYATSTTMIEIGCPVHGWFKQRADTHLQGCGCPECGYARQGGRDTLATFIAKAQQVHGDRYSYAASIYSNYNTPIAIGCSVHGIFMQKPTHHLRGEGCVQCANEARRVVLSEWISRATAVHAGKFDYSCAVYCGAHVPITIICPTHGKFTQTMYKHLHGKGCPQCFFDALNAKKTLTLEEFIRRGREVHGDKYDYAQAIYIDGNTPVKIVCPVHGIFLQRPRVHWVGSGCPACSASHGERQIAQILAACDQEFVREWRHPECCDKRVLPFDFCVRAKADKHLIEYNGQHHYHPMHFGHAADVLLGIQRRDAIKAAWCKKNNIPLLIIPYWEFDNIEKLVTEFLGISKDEELDNTQQVCDNGCAVNDNR